jgi:hypothetical protein
MARKQNRQQPHYVLYVINNLRIYWTKNVWKQYEYCK